MELERRGIPTVTVCTHLFVTLGNIERRSLGMPELPLAVPQHPLGGLRTEAVKEKADALLEQVVAGLTGSTGNTLGGGTPAGSTPARGPKD